LLIYVNGGECRDENTKRQKRSSNDDAEEMGKYRNSLGHILEELVEIKGWVN
jgi:hypothetical protein